MAKLKATETAKAGGARGECQMMGGYGYATEYDMEHHVRTAIASTIYTAGTSEIQRDIIAKTFGLMSSSLQGKTVFMSGGSRGIGLAIAVRAAARRREHLLDRQDRRGRTRGCRDDLQRRPPTSRRQAGHALPIVGRHSGRGVGARRRVGLRRAVRRDRHLRQQRVGDHLSGAVDLPMKRYDLMQDINTRGTFLVSRTCIPHLRSAENPHVLTLSPPPDIKPKWLANPRRLHDLQVRDEHVHAGMAEEFRADGIAFNSLWPRTLIATAAVQNIAGGEAGMHGARKPEIMADAARVIFDRPARECSGNFFFIDDEVLAGEGVSDFEEYRFGPAGAAADPGSVRGDGWPLDTGWPRRAGGRRLSVTLI